MDSTTEALEEAELVIACKTRSYVSAARQLAFALKKEHEEAERWRKRALELEASLKRIARG